MSDSITLNLAAIVGMYLVIKDFIEKFKNR